MARPKSRGVSQKSNPDRFLAIAGVFAGLVLYGLQSNGLEMNWAVSVVIYAICAVGIGISYWRHLATEHNVLGRKIGTSVCVTIVAVLGYFGTRKQYVKDHPVVVQAPAIPSPQSEPRVIPRVESPVDPQPSTGVSTALIRIEPEDQKVYSAIDSLLGPRLEGAMDFIKTDLSGNFITGGHFKLTGGTFTTYRIELKCDAESLVRFDSSLVSIFHAKSGKTGNTFYLIFERAMGLEDFRFELTSKRPESFTIKYRIMAES